MPRVRAGHVLRPSPCYLRIVRVHHVFPYVPEHLGVTIGQWWDGQQQRWPLAAVARSQAAPDTTVHVISRHSERRAGEALALRVHGTAYDNARRHHWGDDWSGSLGRALRRTTPQDVVVVHLEAYAAARLALRAAHGARCVLVLHGRGSGDAVDHLASDAVIALHDDVVAQLRAADVPVRQVIPSVDRRVFRPAQRTRSGIIGYVGRIEESKGAHELPAVLARLADLELRLELVGSAVGLPAPTGAFPESAVLGELSPAAVASKMREWDVLVVPSYTEGMPLVVLEALCSGLPVVAVDGVLPETLARRHGVVTVRRSELAAGVRAALQSSGTDSSWIPDHADGGRVWDEIYDGLGAWRGRPRPSARPLVGRLRRIRR
jgi:glycosyltransferase involved in cell wall biosynthesis